MKLKKTALVIAILFLFPMMQLLHAETKKNDTIQWTTNFAQASELAKKTERPILLFFTGSDWCGWCTKLEKEILENQEFMGATADKLIFVKLDYPMKKKLDAATAKQNEELQKKFAIKGFPTIVLLDPDQQPIGITGYRAGGGKQYAAHLMKMIDEFAAYKEQMKRLGSHKFSGKELKRLYQQAHELGLKNDQNLLVRIGTDSDLSYFFLTERYRFLASHGQKESKEAIAIKEKLALIDPDNKFLSHYQIAMIDFEINNNDAEKRPISTDEIVEPIITYINHYGASDIDHLWRLNLEVYQIYLDQNRLDEALKYAQDSYLTAPSTIQPELAMVIKNIQELQSNALSSKN